MIAIHWTIAPGELLEIAALSPALAEAVDARADAALNDPLTGRPLDDILRHLCRDLAAAGFPLSPAVLTFAFGKEQIP